MLTAVGMVLAASMYAIAGPVTAASAVTAPGMLTYPLTGETQIRFSDGEKPLISVDLTLKSGESRRLIGVLNATMNTTTQTDMDDTATLRCVYPLSGITAGIAAPAEQGIKPLETKVLRPTMLFTAPLDGTYHCYLAAQTTSTTGPYMTVHKALTFLEVSSGDEVGAHMWQNPPCDSKGQFATCTYLGEPGGPTQRFVLDNDGSVNNDGSSPLSPWSAGNTATAINVTANVELTECGHTASCGGRQHDGDSGTVSSYLDVMQLDALGNSCNGIQTGVQTDVINKYVHHYNIAYSLPNVPVMTFCGSTNFRVRVSVRWVSGNSIKIDGSQTNAVAVNSSYNNPVLAKPTLSGGKVALSWTDQSTQEDGFGVFRVKPDGTMVSMLADLATPSKRGTGETMTTIDSAPVADLAQQCYEVYAYDYNAVWVGAKSDIVCVSG